MASYLVKQRDTSPFSANIWSGFKNTLILRDPKIPKPSVSGNAPLNAPALRALRSMEYFIITSLSMSASHLNLLRERK